MATLVVLFSDAENTAGADADDGAELLISIGLPMTNTAWLRPTR